MHTVIIHTLGAAYVKKDIYFLPYDPEQILWLEVDPDRLRECVEPIRNYRQQRTVQEDYRLVILADLDPFPYSEYEEHRETLRQLLRTLYIKELLAPLDETFLTPVSVTTIFLSSKKRDKSTCPIQDLSQLFGITRDVLPQKLELSYTGYGGNRKVLDFTEHLHYLPPEETPAPQQAPTHVETPPAEMRKAMASRASLIGTPVVYPTETEQTTLRANNIAHRLSNAVRNCQSYHPIREFHKELEIVSIPFETGLNNPAAIFADVQIALAKLIQLYEAAADRKEDPAKIDFSQIKPHTRDELGKLLANAEATLRRKRSSDTPKNLYYPLETSGMVNDDPSGLYSDMTERLKKEVANVPGVSDALPKEGAEEKSDTAAFPAKDEDPYTLTAMVKKKLRFGWLRLRRIMGDFNSTYATLQAEYDPDTVYQDQQKIISVCAEEYTKWRTKKRQGERLPEKKTATLSTRPQLTEEPFEELVTARSSCAKGVLEQLHDFTDVRKEAAELHTEFRALTHFWSPDNCNKGATHFRRFSLIVGILFVLFAILPFFLISSQANDLQISRAVVFVITALVFSFLYAVGVIIWLNYLAEKLMDLEYKLSRLLEESKKLRAESIKALLNVYANELPACLIKQLHYDYMVSVDRMNEEATRKYEEHMYIMDQALDEIGDVRTALQLKAQTVEVRQSGALDFSLPPYDPVNRNFYMLFEGGNA